MNILLVNGTVDKKENLITALKLEEKFEYVFKVFSATDAKKLMKTFKIDVILFFIEIPEKSFMEAILTKENLSYDPLIIVCSNRLSPKLLKKYEDIKFDFIYKPFHPGILKSLLLEKTDILKKEQENISASITTN